MIPIICFTVTIYPFADESPLCIETFLHLTQVIVGRWVQNVDISFSLSCVFATLISLPGTTVPVKPKLVLI